MAAQVRGEAVQEMVTPAAVVSAAAMVSQAGEVAGGAGKVAAT